jgi:hypothetical protein
MGGVESDYRFFDIKDRSTGDIDEFYEYIGFQK